MLKGRLGEDVGGEGKEESFCLIQIYGFVDINLYWTSALYPSCFALLFVFYLYTSCKY